MQILNISINNFRNYSTGKFDLSERTFITGPNASGKSSLLEAIYYFSGFKSFRAASDRQLVKHGQEGFGLNMKGISDDMEFSMGTVYSPEGKAVSVNTERIRKLIDAFGIFLSVVFSGADKALVESTPYFRRKYIDRVISTIDREYFSSLVEYHRILKQRNALLKNSGQQKLLDTYTERLSDTAMYIYSARQEFLGYFKDTLFEKFAELSADNDIEVGYVSSKDRGVYRETVLADCLRSVRNDEIRKGRTLFGPHLDDYSIIVSGRDFTKTGSEGERRMLCTAMRFVECSIITENTGNPPVILADDVFAEMDKDRKERILALFENYTQVIITSPNPDENLNHYSSIQLV